MYISLEIGISSIDRSQLNRSHLKTETESSLRNVVFENKQNSFNKDRTMDNAPKHNIYAEKITNSPVSAVDVRPCVCLKNFLL
jgi:hypothetical protein